MNLFKCNFEIKARNVLLIGEDGEKHGVMLRNNAIDMARSAGLDLVEISPNSNPVVCKLMNYGKFKYHHNKKLAQARKKQAKNIMKELNFKANIGSGDLKVKISQISKFVSAGDKVKISVKLRGREIGRPDIAHKVMDEIVEAVSDCATTDFRPKQEGNVVVAIFVPR